MTLKSNRVCRFVVCSKQHSDAHKMFRELRCWQHLTHLLIAISSSLSSVTGGRSHHARWGIGTVGVSIQHATL